MDGRDWSHAAAEGDSLRSPVMSKDVSWINKGWELLLWRGKTAPIIVKEVSPVGVPLKR